MFLPLIIGSAAVLSFFLCALLWGQGKPTASKRLFQAWLLVLGLQLLFYYFHLFHFPNEPTSNLQLFFLMAYPAAMLHSPLLFWYTRALCGESPKSLSMFWHFIPYLAYASLLIFWHFSEGVWLGKGLVQIPPSISLSLQWQGIPIAIVSFVYSFLSAWWLYRYQGALKDFFSFTENIRLNWLKYWIWAYLILFIVIFIGILGAMNLGWFNKEEIFHWVALVIALHIFYLGYFGVRKGGISIAILEEKASAYQKSGLTDLKARTIQKQMLQAMETDQLFLNPELNLNQLAEHLECSPYHLSEVLNQKIKVNFYTFINRYRIKAFKEMAKNPKWAHLSLLGMALECGFNSKSSFNRIFKELEGCSPSEYLKKAKK